MQFILLKIMKKGRQATESMMSEQLSISAAYPIKARHFDYKHFTYPWHFHPEYEIIYIQESSGTRFIGNSADRYHSGDILLLGSNLPHYLSSDECYMDPDETRRVKGTIVQFEQDFMCYALKNYPHFIKIKKLLDDSLSGLYFPAGCSARLLELLDALPAATGVAQILGLLQVLHELSEVPSRQIISPTDFQPGAIREGSRIDKIMAYLNQHYTQQIGLNTVSSFAAMNPSSFCRFFKSKTGRSFKSYLLDMRIAYACKLLMTNDTPVSKISTECGFDTISHFNKCFKKNTGQTPTQYKQVMLKS